MKNREKLQTLCITILTLVIFTLLPANIAWAGRAAQTVPTEGPSPTPSLKSPLPTSTATRTPQRTAQPNATATAEAGKPVSETATLSPGISGTAETPEVFTLTATAPLIQTPPPTATIREGVSTETPSGGPTVVSGMEKPAQGLPAGQRDTGQEANKGTGATPYLVYGCLLGILLILLAAGLVLFRRRAPHQD